MNKYKVTTFTFDGASRDYEIDAIDYIIDEAGRFVTFWDNEPNDRRRRDVLTVFSPEAVELVR